MSVTALKFIKDYCNRFNVACCNFILTELKTSLEKYHPSFASRWGPRAKICELPTWDNEDFNLTVANTKKCTQAISFNAKLL